MKYLIRIVAVLCVLVLASCSKSLIGTEGNQQAQGVVTDDDRPAASTQVLVLTASGHDLETQTDPNGHFSVDVAASETVVGVVAVRPLKSGLAAKPEDDGTFSIQLEGVPKPMPPGSAPETTTDELWFGKYDEQDGNLRFRYQHTFNRFYCINWMPWVFPYTISPDPNRWTSWDLSDFLAPWKGKKLLVPTRYRWWHGAVYGYSISHALYLIARR